MKIYEYVKDSSKSISKLFGVPILETVDYTTGRRVQKFCGGFITTIKIIDLSSRNFIKYLTILGITVLKRTNENNHNVYYLFNKKIYEFPLKYLKKNIEYKYLKIIKKQYSNVDDIYIIWNHLGESWQFLRIAQNYFKKNNSQNPLVITTKPYLNDLVKMLLPTTTCINIKMLHNERLCIENYISKLGNHRLFNIFKSSFFYELEDAIQKGNNIHYFEAILNILQLHQEDLKFAKPIISEEIEKTALEKLKKANIKIENFIYISPEASSNPTLSNKFWDRIKLLAEEMGLDTCYNITGSRISIPSANKKVPELTIAEGFVVAQKAKVIVGVRSGFMEILCSSNKPIFCFYTHFLSRLTPSMSSDKVLNGYNLKKCLYENKNIFEYDAEKNTEEELLKSFKQDLEKIII